MFLALSYIIPKNVPVMMAIGRVRYLRNVSSQKVVCGKSGRIPASWEPPGTVDGYKKKMQINQHAGFSVAPMMDWTNRHCRFFLRQISRRARLYTEMLTAGAVLHGRRTRLLAFHPDEHPVALQLGGADPVALAEAARIGEAEGYDEINLNVGCPSDRVQSGRFGACLMAEPDVVARSVAAMRRAVAVPVTVKHRLGIDDQPAWEGMATFVAHVVDAGCAHVIVHARKAWLQGLSPKQNREVPPLDYGLVYRLKETFPALSVTINGGITDLDAAAMHLDRVDGAMLGRAAYHDPYVLAEVDRRFFGETAPAPSRHEIAIRMLAYIEAERSRGTPVTAVTRHMLGLFNGIPGARAWRRHLATHTIGADVGPEVVRAAAALVAEPTAAVA